MATSFPTSLDALTNPTSTDTLASPDHAAQHANANDAIEAIEAAIGTTAAPVLAKLASPTFTGTPAAPTASIGTNTTQLATTAFVAVQLSPIGMITAYAGSTAPTNWQLCYGQAISRTTYASLFAVISTTYGVGDGSTTFNLPDLRGRTVAGLDNMGGTDAGRLSTANTLGTTTGAETVTLTSAQSGVPAHSHANTVTNNAVTTGAGSSHSHGNTLTGTTTFASNGHTHVETNAYTTGYQANNGNAFTLGGTVSNGSVSSGGNSAAATVGISNAAEAAHTHSVTSNVTISNVNNTAANAASATNIMQPTMTVNYIILAGA